MAGQGIRFTDDPARQQGSYCGRCGFLRAPEDLRKMIVPVKYGPVDEIEVKACGKCRAALNGKGT